MIKKVKALLRPHPPERVCQIIPTNVSQNLTFIVDVSTCKSWDDWKCDDMGAWRNNGTKKHMFYHKNGIIEAAQKRKVEVGDAYTLVRMYYKIKLPQIWESLCRISKASGAYLTAERVKAYFYGCNGRNKSHDLVLRITQLRIRTEKLK